MHLWDTLQGSDSLSNPDHICDAGLNRQSVPCCVRYRQFGGGDNQQHSNCKAGRDYHPAADTQVWCTAAAPAAGTAAAELIRAAQQQLCVLLEPCNDAAGGLFKGSGGLPAAAARVDALNAETADTRV